MINIFESNETNKMNRQEESGLCVPITMGISLLDCIEQ